LCCISALHGHLGSHAHALYVLFSLIAPQYGRGFRGVLAKSQEQTPKAKHRSFAQPMGDEEIASKHSKNGGESEEGIQL